MITREFNLYLHAGHSIPLVINANQYDRGEQWLFTLFNADGTQYTPSSGAIVGIKSDNLGIINAGEVDGLGRVLIDETEQMTAAVGKAVFELLIDDQTHGTANFIVLVEPKPGDNADLSESDYSLIQQAIDGTSETAIAQGVSDWMDENLTPTTPVVDTSLTVSGAAADSAKVGQEISDLKSQISSSQGLTAEFKTALENFAKAVAFKNDDPLGQTYIDALHTAMYPPANLSRIEAVYTQGSTVVYNTDSIDSLKANLVVTAFYDNGTSEAVSAYSLSGALEVGTSTISVAYGGKTASFTVVVSKKLAESYYFTIANKTVADGFINDSGEVATNAGSQFVDELSKGRAFALLTSEFGRLRGTYRIAEYDSNGDFVRRSYATDTFICGDSGCEYVKVGWSNLTPIYAMVFGKMDDAVFSNENYRIGASDGVPVSQSGYHATGFIAVNSPTDRHFVYSFGGTIVLAFYDESNEFISSVTSQSSHNVIGSVPQNAKYFRMSKPTSSIALYPIVESGD